MRAFENSTEEVIATTQVGGAKSKVSARVSTKNARCLLCLLFHFGRFITLSKLRWNISRKL